MFILITLLNVTNGRCSVYNGFFGLLCACYKIDMFLKKLNGFKNILTVTLPFVRGYVVGARHAPVLMDAPRIAKAHSIEWFKFKLA